MKKDWFSRLLKVIEDDGRDMKAISLAAKCGPNYVQQMIKDGKKPGTDRFVRLLGVLGRPASLYVILGAELTAEQEELMGLVFGVPEETQKTVRDLLRQYPSHRR